MNLTQSRLAETLGVSGAAYNNWETGKNDASFQVYKKLLEMGATVEELFDVEYVEMHFLKYAETVEGGLVTQNLENEVKELKAMLVDQENMKKYKEKVAANYFNNAKNYIEKENLENEDIVNHFIALYYHYSIITDIGKKLDSVDLEHLNDLIGFVEKRYKREYFIGEREDKLIEAAHEFDESFDDFAIYCYNYCHQLGNSDERYFDKAVEVMKNLSDKISGKNRSVSEYKIGYLENLKKSGWIT